MAIVVVHGEEMCMMKLPSSDDSLEKCMFSKQVSMELLQD